jgi:hypothetical protein
MVPRDPGRTSQIGLIERYRRATSSTPSHGGVQYSWTVPSLGGLVYGHLVHIEVMADVLDSGLASA